MSTTLGYPRLLGDIGGTNARFAWAESPGAAWRYVAQYPCRDHPTLKDAIAHFLTNHGGLRPVACGLGIANPVVGDQVQMTNHDWSVSIDALRQSLGVAHLVVLNDFTALALSLPALTGHDLMPLGGGGPLPGEAQAVLGPGTGLGVSGLVCVGPGRYKALTGEGGHVSLAPSGAWENEVLAVLRERFGHVSAERALSGPGLVNLYQACCTLAGTPAEALAPADVVARARAGGHTPCAQAISLFCNWLGNVAGNLALTLGARGGVYVGGGIAPRLLPELRASRFRERFEGKGRFSTYLQPIPTWVIDPVTPPAFRGASRALDELLAP